MEKATLITSITSVLDSVTTINKLLQVWPEVREFIPTEPINSTSNLPVLPITELNKLIGLT